MTTTSEVSREMTLAPSTTNVLRTAPPPRREGLPTSFIARLHWRGPTMGVKLGLGIVSVAAIGVGAGLWLASSAPPAETFTNTPLVSFGSSTESPAQLPNEVSLPVPFTSQAPNGDWASSQHDCEEATLVMVDRYLRGDHSGGQIDPATAQAAINRMTPWKQAEDLTDAQLGEMAHVHLD